MFYIKYLTMYKVHMHAGAIWLCVCTGDNPLAKDRGLSSRKYAQTIQQLKLICFGAAEHKPCNKAHNI